MSDFFDTVAIVCPILMISGLFASYFAFIRYLHFREQTILAPLEHNDGGHYE